MNLRLSILLLIFSLIFILYVYTNIKKRKIDIKYALIWIVIVLILDFAIIFPKTIENFSNFIGIEVVSNFVFFFLVGILFFLSFLLTVIISGHRKRITLLIQEIAILKKEVE